MKLWAFFIAVTLPLLESDGANILAVLPLPARSHLHTSRPILRELSNRGHNVTHITTLPVDNANYKQIILPNTLEVAEKEMNFFEMRKNSWFHAFLMLSFIGEMLANFTLSSPEVQEVIHSNDLKFDLILLESTFSQEVYAVFSHKFNAPIIEIQTLPATFWLSHLVGNPYTFSYIIDYYLPLTDTMSFWERLQNTLVGSTTVAIHRFFNLRKHQALADKYMRYPGWETRPPLIELLSNISLVIINTHIIMHYPHPNNPNIIEVPGIHIKPPKKLPQELQTYLDNATEGVIYFSLGSVLNASTMAETSAQALISAFSKLPYRVLWKWEADSMINQPSNVKISKWFPQTDILAHKNIKAFLTHGGINSLTEAVYHGVPLVVIPFFGDQRKNSKQVESSGIGLVLEFDNITEESVIWSINEITKPSYRAAAKKRSTILRDVQMPPLDTVMYWIEYVIRHQGAPHLRSAATYLTWYQYLLIDVVAFLILALVFVLLIAYLVLKVLLKFLRGRKPGKKSSKKKKKK